MHRLLTTSKVLFQKAKKRKKMAQHVSYASQRGEILLKLASGLYVPIYFLTLTLSEGTRELIFGLIF